MGATAFVSRLRRQAVMRKRDEDVLLRPDWPMPPGVCAVMTTRTGGVSEPPFDTLNLGLHSGDDPARVAQNRARLRRLAALPAEPRWLRQVHGVTVPEAGAEAWPEPPEADGAWTRTPGVVLAVMAADCLPVLLARDDGGAVAALHAGWRGLAAGVVEAGLAALPGDVRRWRAWLGPRIGPEHFLVHDDVRDAFPDDARAFTRAPDGRWHADLGALACSRLEHAGIAVCDSRLCTAADPARFFSHRRDGRCGRMAALVWLTSAGGSCKVHSQ